MGRRPSLSLTHPVDCPHLWVEDQALTGAGKTGLWSGIRTGCRTQLRSWKNEKCRFSTIRTSVVCSGTVLNSYLLICDSGPGLSLCPRPVPGPSQGLDLVLILILVLVRILVLVMVLFLVLILICSGTTPISCSCSLISCLTVYSLLIYEWLIYYYIPRSVWMYIYLYNVQYII